MSGPRRLIRANTPRDTAEKRRSGRIRREIRQKSVVPGETTQDDGQTGQMKPASLSGLILAVLARTAAEMLCEHPCEGKRI